MVNKNIVELFGDTPIKKGGNLPVWLCYEHLGIEFNFLNNSWNDTENPLIFICLFTADKSKRFNCNLCLNGLSEKTYSCKNNCKMVNYCSQKCYDIHYPLHSKFCI